MIIFKKASTFLKYSNACGDNLFLKQDELQQHDHKKKDGKNKTKQCLFRRFVQSIF